MDAVLSISVDVQAKNVKRNLKSNILRRSYEKETFEDICEDVIGDLELSKEEDDALDTKNVRVCISAKNNFIESFSPTYEDALSLALEFNKDFKYVKFTIDVEPRTEGELGKGVKINAFDKVMGAGQAVTKLPKRKNTEANRFTGRKSPSILLSFNTNKSRLF